MDDDVSPADPPGGATAVPISPGTRTSRATGLWWKILLFAAGVLVGVLGVGLLNTSTPDFVVGGAAGGAAGPGAQPQGRPTVAPGCRGARQRRLPRGPQRGAGRLRGPR